MGFSFESRQCNSLQFNNDSITSGSHESILVFNIPIFCNNLIIGTKEKANAALGCKPLGIITTSLFSVSSFLANDPPVVMPQTCAPLTIESSKAARVSSVFPEYEEQITNVFLFTQFGTEYPRQTKNGISIHSFSRTETTSPPIADPPIPAGMGGSAIGGDVVSVLEKECIDIPFFVCRGYSVPNWVNKNTLVICSSYSGNTEETLAALDDSMVKGAQVCGITTGGSLAKKLETENKDVVIIPSGLQPRAALAFSFVPMIKLLQKIGILNTRIDSWLPEVIESLLNCRELHCLDSNENPIIELADQIHNKIPIIYSDNSSMNVAALRLKGQICENSKMLCYHNDLPELNHNEIVGWENNSILFDHLFLIWLSDKADNERVKHRMAITQTILNEKKVDQHVIKMKGNLFQVRFLNMIHYGDWLSYWCAIAHNTDPSPVSNIDRLKKELSKIK